MSKKFGIKLTKQKVMDNITKYISAIFIVVLLVLLTATQPNFLGTYNMKNLLRDPAPLMLMASGMGMVPLLGSIDLSMGAVCSVTNVMYLKLMMTYADRCSNTILLSFICMGICLVTSLYALGQKVQ
jgi:ribose/xylose/arabinose/galactoside ABC-type transport system permease subunit